MEARAEQENQAARLAALVHPHYPVTVEESPHEGWEVASAALLARLTGTLEAIVQLRPLGRVADEIILGRSLFDHAVTFAWLAADPGSDRLDRFKRTDAVERLKIGNHCRALGIDLLGHDMRTYFENIRGCLEHDMPSLLQRAEQADLDWTGRLPEMEQGTMMSYTAFYASLYRHHSGYEHPSTLGFLAVAEDQVDGTTVIGLESKPDEALLGMTNTLYTWSLCIASSRLGWPDEADVAEAWAG